MVLAVIPTEQDIGLVFVFDEPEVLRGRTVWCLTTVGGLLPVGGLVPVDGHFSVRRRPVRHVDRARTVNPGTLHFLHCYSKCSAMPLRSANSSNIFCCSCFEPLLTRPSSE